MTPILYAKRRRLRFHGIPELFRCAAPLTIAKPRTDFSRITGTRTANLRMGHSPPPSDPAHDRRLSIPVCALAQVRRDAHAPGFRFLRRPVRRFKFLSS
jgi:hypothetical protein